MAKDPRPRRHEGAPVIPIAEIAKRWNELHKGGYRGARSLIAEAPLPNDLTEVGRHLFGDLVSDADLPSGFFYNQGFFLPGCDPADFPASRENVISPALFYKLLCSLRTMERGGRVVPEAAALRDYARSVFAGTNAVPIGIIDIEYQALEDIDFERVFLAEGARFCHMGRAECATYRLFVAAPLFEAIESSDVSFVHTARTTIDRRQKGARYGLQIGRDAVNLRVGEATSAFQIRGDYLPLRVMSTAHDRSVLTWLAHHRPQVPLFTHKAVIGRKVNDES